MTALTPAALQELKYAANEEVLNRRDAVVPDRKAMPWWSFLEKNRKEVSGLRNTLIVKYQQSSGIRGEHFAGRDVLTFNETRVDLELSFSLARTHMGFEVLHEELEQEGYTVEPNGSRGNAASLARKVSVNDMFRLMNIFEQKIDDYMDNYDVYMDETLLRDGTQDPLAPIGLFGYLTDTPAVGTIGGQPRSNPNLQHKVNSVASTVGSGGTLERDLNKLVRDANLNNRGTASRIDFIMAGAKWIDQYVDYAKNNGLRFEHPPTEIKKLDIGIPDSSIHFNEIPIVHNPTFEILDQLGLEFSSGVPFTRVACMLASKTWKLCHTPGRHKHFSAPMDPPDQRFSRMSLDGRHSLVPMKINGNAVNIVEA